MGATVTASVGFPRNLSNKGYITYKNKIYKEVIIISSKGLIMDEYELLPGGFILSSSSRTKLICVECEKEFIYNGSNPPLTSVCEECDVIDKE